MDELKERLELQNATVTITDNTVQIKPKKAEQLKRMLTARFQASKLKVYLTLNVCWLLKKAANG